MSLWAIFAAPLIMGESSKGFCRLPHLRANECSLGAGNDLRNVSEASKAILLNKAAIAIDQDRLGKMGRRINTTAESEVWARELEGGDVAVALFNKNGGAPAGIKLIEQGACAQPSRAFSSISHSLSDSRGQTARTRSGLTTTPPSGTRWPRAATPSSRRAAPRMGTSTSARDTTASAPAPPTTAASAATAQPTPSTGSRRVRRRPAWTSRWTSRRWGCR